ncbi:MAG TPA: ATP-binding protein [Puia sp.]|jgi:two-component system sensor histidine kinase CiaH|nr:ATP-binding protein [Puia sp.]
MSITRYKFNWTNRAIVICWLLLIYVLAALIWWYIALNLQNDQMAANRLELLTHDDPSFPAKIEKIKTDHRRLATAYKSEGLTFILVILAGAIFLRNAIIRQFRIQRQQQNFMMAITHELKTPISIARLNIETLQKHQLDESKKEKILKSSLHEINRLNTLTENILVSAQLEAGSYLINKEDLNFSRIVSELCSDYASRFPNRPWKQELDQGIFLSGDPLLIQILVNNLIENAVKYSAPTTLITVILKKDDEHGVLKVMDEGVGIPKKEYKRIFQKFYRVGNEDTRTAQGTGLGLYLCRKITQDHKMRLEVSDNQPRGSIFTVRFNLIQT